MYTLDDILRLDNFEQLSHKEILEIILILKNELKYQMYKRDNNNTEILKNIEILKSELLRSTELNQKYKDVIINFNKIYGRKLTFKERLFGKINTNITIDTNK